RTSSGFGAEPGEKGAEADRGRGRRGSASRSAQRGEDARTIAASNAARARPRARTNPWTFAEVDKKAAYRHATSKRPGSSKALHEISQRLLRVLRLHHAGRQEDAHRPQFECLRDVLAGSHARAAEHIDLRVRSANAIDGLRDDFRLS